MGQQIEVAEAVVLDSVAVFDTDRTFSGQDGVSYSRSDEVDVTFPSQLAGRLFESDTAVDHVFVFSNTVSVRRPGGWEEGLLSSTRDMITNFFVFYDENKAG